MSGKKSTTDKIGNSTRRNLLRSGALAGAAGLAGCGGDSDDTPTSTSTSGGETSSGSTDTETSTPGDAHVSGQTLRIPQYADPSSLHFIADAGRYVESPLNRIYWSTWQAISETPLWGKWMGDAWETTPERVHNESIGLMLSDWEIKPHKLSVTIREDATWSDGEPITARDGVAQGIYWSPIVWMAHENEQDWSPAPEDLSGSCVYDIAMPDGPDGKRYELRAPPEYSEGDLTNEQGWFNGFENNAYWLANPWTRFAPHWPAHVEPYKSMADHLIELAQEKPDPTSLDFVGRGEFTQQHITPEDLEASREDPPPSSGAWKVESVRGTEGILLTPNEHYTSPIGNPEPNFDEVFLSYHAEDRRSRAALQAGEMDYISVDAPETFTQSLPDSVEVIGTPAGGGSAIAFNHNSFWGDNRVRKAVAYALDTETIANNIHQVTHQGINVPGGEMWKIDEVLDQSWVDENLESYDQDLDKAESLMQEAGFEMQDGVWHKDGEPFEFQLASDEPAPSGEVTIAEQLQSFGMDIRVQTYEQGTFDERIRGSERQEYIDEEYGGEAEFTFWDGGYGPGFAGGYFSDMQALWWNLFNAPRRIRAYNVFPHDVQESAIENWDAVGPADAWKDWTIEIPKPVGDPEGELTEFQAPYWSGKVSHGGRTTESTHDDVPAYKPEEEGYTYWQMHAWLLNQHLPVIPYAMQQRQHFFNTKNWKWPGDLPGEANQTMWNYFWAGFNNIFSYVAHNQIQADPENPKDGAEVTR